MSLFGKSKSWMRPSSEPQAGLSRGTRPGDLGIWVVWDKSNPVEVYRVTVSTETQEKAFVVQPYTYTFLPGHNESFLQSCEPNYELREFLRGKERAHTGKVHFEVLLSDGQKNLMSVKFAEDVETVFWCMRGEGSKPHPEGKTRRPAIAPDSPETAAIKPSELKSASEKVRKELEEKRKREEEARAKAEAEKAAAAAKAAEAAKAAADKAAGKAAGGPAAGGPTITSGKMALFYGSSTGNTASIAEMIKQELGASLDHVRNIAEIVPQDLTFCEIILIGIPTWHIGELQDDWAAFLPEMKKLNFKGKKVAIFGLGDGKGYPDTYVDAMWDLWEICEKTGATLYGRWPTEGYEFQKSKAIKDGKFLGLVIDVENQHNLSEGRVKAWVAQLKKELSL